MPPKLRRNVQLLKWNNQSKAHEMLRKGMEDGTIDRDGKPKAAYDSNVEFQKYPLASFRSAFNRVKAQVGGYVEAEGKFINTQTDLNFTFL